MNTTLDHIVVAAATLDQGVAWCEASFGITPGPGGQHPLFGTHNRLFKLGGAAQHDAYPDCFFEIIAIDPEATAPVRPRWFGLDDVALQARLRSSGPELLHLVVRSPQIDMHRWGLISIGHQPGEPVRASRDTPHGRLEWDILVRPDGALPLGGALPTLIQWTGAHPAQHMADPGIALASLTLRGPSPRVRDVLRLRGVVFEAGPGPAVQASFNTPKGLVVLASHAQATG